MSGSYLRRRDEQYPVYEQEVGKSSPVSGHTSPSYGGYPFYDVSQRTGKEQIERILDLVFRRKWTILISFLVVLVGAIAYSFTRTPRFETGAYVSVDLGPRTIVDRDPSGVGENLFARNDRSLQGEVRLLQISDQLQMRVAERMTNGFPGELLNGDSSSRESIKDSRTQPGPREGRLTGYVKFFPERIADNIIQIRGVSSDPVHAAQLANLYADEYVRLTQEASRTYISALRKSLQGRETERLDELNEVEDQIRTYLSQEGAVGLDQAGTRMVQQIASLEAQGDDLRIRLQTERALLANLEYEISDVNPNIADRIASQRKASSLEQRIQDVQNQLVEEENELSQILRANPNMRDRNLDVLEPYNRGIKFLRAEVDSLVNLYVAEATSLGSANSGEDGLTYLANLQRQASKKRITIGGIEAQIDAIDDRIGEYQRELLKLPGQSMELAQLERSRLHAERMYQFVVERLQAARIAEESEPGYAQLIRTASVPLLSVYPNHVRDLILGAVLGLLLGIALAIMREKLDNRIYQPKQVREHGFKEIAVIPNLRPLIERDHRGKDFLELDGRKLSTSLVSLVNPISAASEAYRQVRTYTLFNLPNTDLQTLLISSPGMMEGKSTTAANLAIVMAQAGRRTLLIDADLRRPHQHRLFGLERESGLRELLINGSDYDDNSWKTFVDNLYVLTAEGTDKLSGGKKAAGDTNGHLPLNNPAELLGSKAMAAFLDMVKTEFDTIIFDTPPVLAATDATLLSTQCDATIVVARTGHTKEGELDYTMEAFTDVGARILGVVLNAFDISMAFGHKYRYQHYTKYGRYPKYGYGAGERA